MTWDTTALLFPGQGSQAVGMGQDIAQHHSVAAATIEQASQILDMDFGNLMWHSDSAILDDTINTQPALFVTSLAIWRALNAELEARGRPPANPRFVAGHSLGELTALVAAGALDFENGLRLVRERGRLMKAAGERAPGGMAAIIGLETDTLHDICQAASTANAPVVVANDNCPGQVVISGDERALEAAMQQAEAAGARRVIRLNVSIAAHSPLMTAVAEEFKEAVAATPFTEPRIPTIGNSTAEPLADVASIRAELNAQLTSSVRWTESIQYMRQQGVEHFVEIGSRDVLVGLVRRIDRQAQRTNVETAAQFEAFLEGLAD